MPVPGRLFANDEELGKKDDEYRPGVNGILPAATLLSKWRVATPRMRKRRLGLAFVAAVLVFLFVRNMPTDLQPVGDRLDVRVPGRNVRGNALEAKYAPESYGKEAPTGAPMANGDNDAMREQLELGKHYYNGQIKWYYLASTLQGAARSMGYQMFNKNVVFVAASPQSVSRLVPFACEMARWQRNVVHFVLLGRDDLTIDEYKELNGVDDSCKIYWHDARPDYAPFSSDQRFELNTYQSLIHVHNFLHPQLYMTDDLEEEEAPFVKGLEGNARRFGTTLLPLPTDALHQLQWLTRLDSGSLAAWHNTYVEILIHAPPKSSGSLIRLLQSIEKADYFGIRYPHLTIELPYDLDKPTKDFLQNFIWPPLPRGGGIHTSQLTLRRRIPHATRLTATEASIRMVESFYPSRARDSHVLLLSHQVELSPLYYHYLIYNLLEYKYSFYAEGTRETEQLMGISLALPSRLLDGETRLKPPVANYDQTAKEEYGKFTPFLWQAPDVHATLYFGNKWMEFHSFLSNRMNKGIEGPQKHVSVTLPAVAEYLLDIMRIRNYFVLYPHVPDYSIATIHDEIYQIPEEFMDSKEDDVDESENSTTLRGDDEPLLSPVFTKSHPRNDEKSLAYTALHKLLPADGDLPELSTLPTLGFRGNVLGANAASKEATNRIREFRSDIGKCPAGYEPVVLENSADDLFCYGDKDYSASVASEGDDGFNDGIPPIGFGGAKARDAIIKSDGPVDEYGNPLEPEVSEAKKADMAAEFQKHLHRQRNQASKKPVEEDRQKEAKTESKVKQVILDDGFEGALAPPNIKRPDAKEATTEQESKKSNVVPEEKRVILDDGTGDEKTINSATKEHTASSADASKAESRPDLNVPTATGVKTNHGNQEPAKNSEPTASSNRHLAYS